MMTLADATKISPSYLPQSNQITIYIKYLIIKSSFGRLDIQLLLTIWLTTSMKKEVHVAINVKLLTI